MKRLLIFVLLLVATTCAHGSGSLTARWVGKDNPNSEIEIFKAKGDHYVIILLDHRVARCAKRGELSDGRLSTRDGLNIDYASGTDQLAVRTGNTTALRFVRSHKARTNDATFRRWLSQFDENLNHLLELDLGIIMHHADYPKATPFADQVNLMFGLWPYVKGVSTFYDSGGHQPFLPNPRLSDNLADPSLGESKALTVFEAVPDTRGGRCVAYADRHAEWLSAAEWESATGRCGISADMLSELRKTALPLSDTIVRTIETHLAENEQIGWLYCSVFRYTSDKKAFPDVKDSEHLKELLAPFYEKLRSANSKAVDPNWFESTLTHKRFLMNPSLYGRECADMAAMKRTIIVYSSEPDHLGRYAAAYNSYETLWLTRQQLEAALGKP